MQLPGGICTNGQPTDSPFDATHDCRRDYRFAPLTGTIELSIREVFGTSADAANNGTNRSHPARITAVLSSVLDSIGAAPADRQRVQALSIGDRQFLIRQLAARLEPGPQWLSTHCVGCGELFEISFEHSALPIKLAGDGYPACTIDSSAGPLRVRVPTGLDQEQLAAEDDDGDAMQLLLKRLVRRDNAQSIAINELSDADRDEIGDLATDFLKSTFK